MIKNIKTGIKLLRYSFHLTLNLLGFAVLLLFGIFSELVSQETVGWTGCYFIIMAAVMFTHMLYSLSSSKIILSSTYRKQIQTSIPSIFSTLWCFIGYTLTVIIKGILLHLHPENRDNIELSIIATYGILLALAVYEGIAYKYFVLSVLILFIDIVTITIFATLIYSLLDYYGPALSFTQLAAIGYVFVLLSGLIQYGISCLLYKTEISKAALGRALTKYM